MNVRVLIEGTDKQGFNDRDHLENFLHYLYRTDERQKHTNKNTEYCVVNFYFDGVITSIPLGEVDRRTGLNDVSLELIEAYGLDEESIVSDVTYLSFVDGEGKDVKGQIEYEKIVGIINKVILQREDFDQCLFHVAHLDQGDYHIHSVMVK